MSYPPAMVVHTPPWRGYWHPPSPVREPQPRRRGSARVEALFGEEDERRLDAPADVLCLWQVKLGEDRVHVLLDGSLGQNELLSDRAVAFAGGDLAEQLSFAWRELSEAGLRRARPRSDQDIDDGRIDDRASACHRLDCPD